MYGTLKMIWAERTVGLEGARLQRILKEFANHFDILKRPLDMMLISVDSASAQTSRIIIGLPDKEMLSSYAGFSQIRDSDLPREATLLIGYDKQFAARFALSSH